ncbi:MAG: response regulator transcription factor, partial [Solirubrobacterales bacterium]|nr:response regulator transcription factor [Solirubrobacterales bacterium]
MATGADRMTRASETEATKPVSVVVAEDDVLLREGLASLLEREGFHVVGQAGDGARLIELTRELHPDLVLVDIRMPPTHSTEGLDAARVIRAESPTTAIVVLSAYVDVDHAMELLAEGERTGYLLKSRVTDVDDFVQTLGHVAEGGSIVDPVLVHELVAAQRKDDPLGEL